ncbi:unnamed protein product [Linum trigynum]|uniref:Uncharacterized protein n=1 Tax=Linum trigynum TaxID=586398 RepID=A0AAV2D3I4_9ROSI
MISPLSIDLGQFIFGRHFRNFLCDERPFSLDIEGYRSRMRPEAILHGSLSPLSTDSGRFILGQFLADSKGVPSQISGDLSEMLFSFDSGGYRSRNQAEAILHR